MSTQRALRITNGKYWTKKMPLAVGTTKGKAKTFEQLNNNMEGDKWQHYMRLQAIF